MENATRLRIRFRKEGDLRWLGHRDVARTWERAFRRAGLRLKRTQGFHPKDKISFPLALSLGIVGTEEILEVEIQDDTTADQVQTALTGHLPTGLKIERMEKVEAAAVKAPVEFVVYEVPVAAERCGALQTAVQTLWQQPEYWISRPPRVKPIDLRAGLIGLELRDGVLLIKQRVTQTATANPREILAALGVSDDEQAGYTITRTKVETAAAKHNRQASGPLVRGSNPKQTN